MSNNQQPTTNNIIGVIGSGAMGAGIAQVAATAGHEVIVYDNNQAALDKAKSNLESTLKKLVEKQKLTEQTASEIFARTKYASNLQDFKNCGLIIEAIIENLDVKQKVFSELENIVSPDCILASNTSSLSIASIASACKNSNRVIGIHFFNPAPLMPLVEIIPAITTDEAITSESKKLIDSWGKVTVLTKDTPGFIVNRVARSYYGESIRIYEEGMADFATIDWALKTYGGFKMGPFELMDFIGNDINYKVTESVWEQFFYEPRFKPSLTQKRLFEAKLFGRKSGRGYYNYAEGAPMPEPKQNEELGKYIFNRVIAMLINEAVDSLYLQLATKEDLDLAMTKGVNYPKGLLKWSDEIGLAKVLNTLEVMYELYGEDRYRPCVLMKMMVKDGKRFFN
ncbi:MAG: 3-hydroxyacyl-CoA dehydrogenase NAD-binding domain-containing protein [Bacteroidia bacterium]|nr:3-hydroxyacyl-CoA dehydrogenase NAD-binding domain-containing protein [Bacteroidia bacterium]